MLCGTLHPWPSGRGPTTRTRTPAAWPQAFGHLLYGHDQWAALDGAIKHVRGLEAVVTYDLAADPLEHSPRPGSLEPLRVLLEAAGLAVVPVWRLGSRARTRSAFRSETLTVRHPAGFSATWGPYDLSDQISAPTVNADGSVTVSADGNRRRPTGVYLLPRHPDAAGFSVSADGVQLAERNPEGALWSGGNQTLRDDISVRPLAPDWQIDEALEKALLALGYVPGGR